MKPSKRLALTRIAITDLTTDELRGMPGGNNAITPACPTVYVECPSDPVTGCTIIHETRYASCVACTATCPTDICA